MRLARGAGVRGLAAIRPAATVPGSGMRLIRPLLGWRRAELEQIFASGGSRARARPEQRGRAVRASPHPSRARAKRLARPRIARRKRGQPRAMPMRRSIGRPTRSGRARSPRRTPKSFIAQPMPLLKSAAGSFRAPSRASPPKARAPTCAAANSTGCCRSSPGAENRPFAVSLCSGGETWRFVAAPNRTRPVDNLR